GLHAARQSSLPRRRVPGRGRGSRRAPRIRRRARTGCILPAKPLAWRPDLHRRAPGFSGGGSRRRRSQSRGTSLRRAMADPSAGDDVMSDAALIARLLDVIENDVVPKTEQGVASGNKLFGAAILRKSDLSLVLAETNNET